MLQCADGSYYIGSATGDDLWKRIAEHETGAYRGYTYTRRPVQLAWSEHFDRITDAIAVERKIKGWSRAKKCSSNRGRLEEDQAASQAAWRKPKSVILRCAPKARLEGCGRGARAVALRGSLRSHLRVTVNG
ncbi:MAG: GIY-YIG nuclease family protein [Xanthobacteraceae bacterium]